ncbi:MAG: MFS transporter, partial [Chitinophagales bacterium]|nr:MFS transporter [Chitinophagales bacterium]
MKNRLPLKIAYAIGQFGWSLASFGVANLLNYFYMPPDNGEHSLFPHFIFQGFVMGLFTILGLISFTGRFFDGIWDTYIAQRSDKAVSKFGRRRIFMIGGIFPFAISSLLIFYPISSNSDLNTLWLIAMTIIFYVSMTLYVVPYAALMSELAEDPKDRLFISTLISVTWAAGSVFGNLVYSLEDYFSKSMSHVDAFQLTMLLFTIIATLAMLVPILFINEEKHCKQMDDRHDYHFLVAVKKVFQNRAFKNFIISDLAYWTAVSIIQIGMVYYVHVLLKLELKTVTEVFTGIYLLSFSLYVPIVWIANRLGKRRTQIISFWMTIVVYLLIACLGKLPFASSFMQIAIIGIIIAFPLATFGIIPNAIVGDIIDKNYEHTGERSTAMFYAVRSFVMKCGISIANLIFPSLMLLGN